MTFQLVAGKPASRKKSDVYADGDVDPQEQYCLDDIDILFNGDVEEVGIDYMYG